MTVRLDPEGATYLKDTATGRVVGFRNSDGTDTFFATKASEDGPNQWASGTVAAPGAAFASDPDTGLFLSSANTIGVAVGGVLAATLSSSGLGLGASADTFLARDAAGIVSISNGSNAMGLRIYNVAGANYERGGLVWSSNELFLTTEKTGSGTERSLTVKAGNQLNLSGSSGSNGQWNLLSSGTLRPGSNDTFDLGQTATRVRNGFFSGYLSIGSGVTAAGFIATGASTTAKPHANFSPGVAPTSPVNGDFWVEASDVKVRLGGVTYTLSKV